jgi:Protein of unknown function (DUF3224)
MTRVTGTFANHTYEDEPYGDNDAVELGRVHITRSFSGDIVGQSTAELLTARSPDGSAAYVGLDRISASFHGRSGTFVLQHWGIVSTEGASTAGAVVPGSGTGELRGLRGEGKIAVDENGTHTLELEYDFAD